MAGDDILLDAPTRVEELVRPDLLSAQGGCRDVGLGVGGDDMEPNTGRDGQSQSDEE